MIWLFIIGALGQNCSLIPGEEASAPNPSLVKCYRQNNLACCISAHDQNIQAKYAKLLPTQCQREYDNLEDYFCFACHSSQGKYVDSVNMTVTLCPSYAENVWGGDLDKPSTSYDNCGVYTY